LNTEQEKKHFFFEKRSQKALDMRQIRIESDWLPCVRAQRGSKATFAIGSTSKVAEKTLAAE